MGYWKISSRTAPIKPTETARDNTSMLSLTSLFPKAWAVKPLVPIRRKLNPQYSILKIIAPREIAPICIFELVSRCPTSDISTILSNGTVMLLMILGTARLSMRLFNFCLFFKKCETKQMFISKQFFYLIVMIVEFI